MAFGNPDVIPNMAFEEFNQGLQPGLQSLYHGIAQRSAFDHQDQLEANRESARQALQDSKQHADNSAYHDLLKHAYGPIYDQMTEGMTDQQRLSLPPAAMHQSIEYMGQQKDKAKAAVGFANSVWGDLPPAEQARYKTPENMANELGPEATHLMATDHDTQKRQAAQDAVGYQRQIVANAITNSQKRMTEAFNSGTGFVLPKDVSSNPEAALMKDPNFTKKPLDEQQSLLMGYYRDKIDPLVETHLTKHSDEIAARQKAFDQDTATRHALLNADLKDRELARDAQQQELVIKRQQHEDEHIEKELDRIRGSKLFDPKNDPEYKKALTKYNNLDTEAQKLVERPTQPAAADMEDKVRAHYNLTHPGHPLPERYGDVKPAAPAGSATTAPKAMPTAKTPEEARAYAPGTHFIGGDGLEHVRP